jgi:hypothetical protein
MQPTSHGLALLFIVTQERSKSAQHTYGKGAHLVLKRLSAQTGFIGNTVQKVLCEMKSNPQSNSQNSKMIPDDNILPNNNGSIISFLILLFFTEYQATLKDSVTRF